MKTTLNITVALIIGSGLYLSHAGFWPSLIAGLAVLASLSLVTYGDER